MNECILTIKIAVTSKRYRVSFSNDLTLIENMNLFFVILKDHQEYPYHEEPYLYVDEYSHTILDERKSLNELNTYNDMTIVIY